MEKQTITLTLDEFWPWLKRHFNCIIRAGGPGFLLFDQPDGHWYFTEEAEEGLYIAQLFREKELCAEIVFPPEEVVYIQASPDQAEQTFFECIGKIPGEEEPATICHFLLTHGFDEDKRQPRWRH